MFVQFKAKVIPFQFSFIKTLLKNITFCDTDKIIATNLHLFCISMFLEAIPHKTAKFEEISPKEIREITGKK